MSSDESDSSEYDSDVSSDEDSDGSQEASSESGESVEEDESDEDNQKPEEDLAKSKAIADDMAAIYRLSNEMDKICRRLQFRYSLKQEEEPAKPVDEPQKAAMPSKSDATTDSDDLPVPRKGCSTDAAIPRCREKAAPPTLPFQDALSKSIEDKTKPKPVHGTIAMECRLQMEVKASPDFHLLEYMKPPRPKSLPSPSRSRRSISKPKDGMNDDPAASPSKTLQDREPPSHVAVTTDTTKSVTRRKSSIKSTSNLQVESTNAVSPVAKQSSRQGIPSPQRQMSSRKEARGVRPEPVEPESPEVMKTAASTSPSQQRRRSSTRGSNDPAANAQVESLTSQDQSTSPLKPRASVASVAPLPQSIEKVDGDMEEDDDMMDLGDENEPPPPQDMNEDDGDVDDDGDEALPPQEQDDECIPFSIAQQEELDHAAAEAADEDDFAQSEHGDEALPDQDTSLASDADNRATSVPAEETPSSDDQRVETPIPTEVPIVSTEDESLDDAPRRHDDEPIATTSILPSSSELPAAVTASSDPLPPTQAATASTRMSIVPEAKRPSIVDPSRKASMPPPLEETTPTLPIDRREPSSSLPTRRSTVVDSPAQVHGMDSIAASTAPSARLPAAAPPLEPVISPVASTAQYDTPVVESSAEQSPVPSRRESFQRAARRASSIPKVAVTVNLPTSPISPPSRRQPSLYDSLERPTTMENAFQVKSPLLSHLRSSDNTTSFKPSFKQPSIEYEVHAMHYLLFGPPSA
ncbi:unnamed protein product [Aphanomyces euteiches]|uniref:Uncharacterized protein n=1 Tax=Aphanomyces euteiches TaxID=100861 RepID=A0A6G0WXG1_9STRA|nr:hypothetical protein Ae201684_010837 [Aphanomyces euteiches]KAH9061428.1 hypothetical protein Ae201684P_020764 [Aphanomyces euteiches]